jgi:hypothetical protein
MSTTGSCSSRWEKGKTTEEATTYLQALQDPQRPALVLIRDALRESALLTCITTAATVDVYHAQVQAKVRLLDPAQPFFELSTCFPPNKDQRPSSLTRIMSKDRIVVGQKEPGKPEGQGGNRVE